MGTAGEADHNLYQSKLTGSIALVMGAEGEGMRRLTREHCDELVSIPMAGSVSSLNVSVATGVCLFEAVRQRTCFCRKIIFNVNGIHLLSFISGMGIVTRQFLAALNKFLASANPR